MSRPNTPDRINPDGSKTITTKRACNGCGDLIGDLTDNEFTAALMGRPLPDVRQECPACAPTAPPPACIPMKVMAGEVYCLLRDCDHNIPDDADYCREVREEIVCSTHSEFQASPEEDYEAVTHAQPWPCKQQMGAAA
ncbi:hypothetical protein [Streptomyces lancefieldiae]|uniref:Uncharacterized protein n=1 Tax=Streptomyces lancefieldiae TaxID=3075520 RepID=A0ABU3AF29_9ACTN|nr:hypothetical protein [Streptomyces sp. DSM 40712]MDT0608779.1 hypothetical protein [Streptomyces sp. DSM 40712]